ERGEVILVVPCESRIEIFKTHELLATTRTQSHGSLTQTIHQVYVADLKQSQRTEVGRKAAAVIHHVRLFLFDVDDHVALPVTGRCVAGWLGPNDDLSISVSEIQLTLCVRNAIGAEHVALSERNRAADRFPFLATSGLVASHAVDKDLIDEHFLAFISDRVD